MAEEAIEEEASKKPYDKEMANRDFSPFFMDYIALAPGQSRLDLRPYFAEGYTEGDAESWNSEVKFKVPVALMRGFDQRQFELDYKSEARTYGGPGQPFSRGSVHVERVGRFYEFTFYDSGGLDI